MSNSLWCARCLPMVVLVAAGAGTFAGELPSEQDFLGEVPTVLTASRLLQQAADVPVTMTVIDRATIDASGLRAISDLMRLVPGMYVGHGHGVEGIVPVVSYHGLTDEFSRRMLVLIDGRSVNSPLFGTVLWDDLPIAIDDVERIEVTRGPNAASYGANAFFGVINIITRTPIAGESVHALARAGERGVREGVVRYSDASGPVSFRASAGHSADDGFVNVYNNQQHSYATARADVDAGPRDALQVQLGYSEGSRQQGFFSSSVDRPRTDLLQTEFAQLKWQRSDSADDEFSAQYYFERQATEESDQTLPLALPGQPLQAYSIQGSYATSRHDLELQRTLDPFAELRLVLGAGARVDAIYAPIYFTGHPAQQSNLERIFLHAEWRVTPRLVLQSGGMLERNSITGSDLSPRFSLTYHLDGEQTLRASVSQAARTPLLYEEHANYGLNLGSFRDQIDLATGGVRPERMISSELGYHANWPDRYTQVDVKVYHDRATGLIDNIDTPSNSSVRGFVTDPQNLFDVGVAGVECEFHWQPRPRTRVVGTYAYTLILAPLEYPQLGQTMPRNLLSLLVQQQFDPSWSASAAFYENGKLEPLGGRGAVLSARRLDLRLTRKQQLLGQHAEISAGVEDALPAYQDFRPDNVFTRRVYLELRTGL